MTNQLIKKQIYLNRFSLIGMPGSGKSTIGRLTAKNLYMNYFDTDWYIEKTTQKKIPEIFLDGEASFRKIENEALKDILKRKNSIISTGGGIITLDENIKLLKENSIVIFINRPIENIIENVNFKNRPLLNNTPEKIYELYKKRYSIYKSTCDIEISNATSYVKDCIDELTQTIKSLKSHHKR